MADSDCVVSLTHKEDTVPVSEADTTIASGTKTLPLMCASPERRVTDRLQMEGSDSVVTLKHKEEAVPESEATMTIESGTIRVTPVCASVEADRIQIAGSDSALSSMHEEEAVPESEPKTIEPRIVPLPPLCASPELAVGSSPAIHPPTSGPPETDDESDEWIFEFKEYPLGSIFADFLDTTSSAGRKPTQRPIAADESSVAKFHCVWESDFGGYKRRCIEIEDLGVYSKSSYSDVDISTLLDLCISPTYENGSVGCKRSFVYNDLDMMFDLQKQQDKLDQEREKLHKDLINSVVSYNVSLRHAKQREGENFAWDEELDIEDVEIMRFLESEPHEYFAYYKEVVRRMWRLVDMSNYIWKLKNSPFVKANEENISLSDNDAAISEDDFSSEEGYSSEEGDIFPGKGEKSAQVSLAIEEEGSGMQGEEKMSICAVLEV